MCVHRKQTSSVGFTLGYERYFDVILNRRVSFRISLDRVGLRLVWMTSK